MIYLGHDQWYRMSIKSRLYHNDGKCDDFIRRRPTSCRFHTPSRVFYSRIKRLMFPVAGCDFIPLSRTRGRSERANGRAYIRRQLHKCKVCYWHDKSRPRRALCRSGNLYSFAREGEKWNWEEWEGGEGAGNEATNCGEGSVVAVTTPCFVASAFNYEAMCVCTSTQWPTLDHSFSNYSCERGIKGLEGDDLF